MGKMVHQSATIRVALLSDLHLEFEARRHAKGPDLSPLKGQVDLILLAGDIDMSDRAIDFGTHLHSEIEGKVIQIAGNHEFYHANRLRALSEMRRAADASPVHFLENGVARFDIRGRMVRILGCTLWTDYKINNDKAHVTDTMGEISENLNDHHVIYEGSQRTFQPQDALRIHQESRSWLNNELAKPFDGVTIVMTHHAPSRYSVPSRYLSSPITPAFASNLEALIKRSGADLWVHGHTHDSFDYMIGNTRIICNPLGYYAREINPKFRPDLVIEL